MSVHIQISATLRKRVENYDPEKGIELQLPGKGSITARDAALMLGLPMEEIKFVMINGRAQAMETPLHDRDRAAYFPAVGGG